MTRARIASTTWKVGDRDGEGDVVRQGGREGLGSRLGQDQVLRWDWRQSEDGEP